MDPRSASYPSPLIVPAHHGTGDTSRSQTSDAHRTATTSPDTTKDYVEVTGQLMGRVIQHALNEVRTGKGLMTMLALADELSPYLLTEMMCRAVPWRWATRRPWTRWRRSMRGWNTG